MFNDDFNNDLVHEYKGFEYRPWVDGDVTYHLVVTPVGNEVLAASPQTREVLSWPEFLNWIESGCPA